MQNKNGIFNNNDYKYISNFIEEKLPILRQNKKFNEKYLKLTNSIENLEKTLTENQKEQLDEIIQLFYETEEYYFAFSYSLGLKYGKELEEL